jgi:hypothetical protein
VRSRIERVKATCCAALATLFLAAAAQVGDPPLSTPQPIDGDERVHVGDLSGLDCARCHAEVAAEWAATLHAYAWQDEVYQEELGGRRKPQSCHGCHIPQPVHATGLAQKPVARDEDLHLGVTCAACHQGPEGEILGPRGTPTDAHVSRRAESFVGAGSNALCASCHATFVGPVLGVARDFAESARAAAGGSCVECHMAQVERSFALTPGTDGGEAVAAPVRVGRSHALQTPRDPTFLRRAFGLSAGREGELALLAVENRAGHRVPGLIGREIQFEVALLDAAGAVLRTRELRFDAEGPLAVDEVRRVELGAGGTGLRVRGRHVDPRLPEPVEFLDVELPLDP